MPTVPKPSQTKAKKVVIARKEREKKVRKVEVSSTTRSHTIPTRGKSATWLAEITTNGGVTKQELIDGCVPRGLAPTMHIAIGRYCKSMGLLKE
jgi:hypothetical protein